MITKSILLFTRGFLIKGSSGVKENLGMSSNKLSLIYSVNHFDKYLYLSFAFRE